jgi:ectoine hydroxylase-related dioxygenase (phytanoyl-CoA dioxygenase family)
MIEQSVIELFETEGAVAVPGLLDGDWIQSLRDAMPEILQATYDPTERMTGQGTAKVKSRDGIWRECEAFARFLFQSPIGEAAAAVMRSSTVRLYEDLLLYKDAGADGASGWHRDSPHWPLSGHQLSSVWFSLEPVTSVTGAMKFVVGSHLDPDEVATAEMSGLTDSDLASRSVITFEADPGDVVVFHPRVLHTAYGSAPDRPRRTFTIRFMGDDIRWRPRRSVFHPWMRECGLQKGDVLDHPWFPVVWKAPVTTPAGR